MLFRSCASTLTTNECHKLVGLKGPGSAQELETTTLNWLKCYAPLGTADCTNVPATNTSPNSDGSGSSLNPALLLMLFFTLFYRKIKLI